MSTPAIVTVVPHIRMTMLGRIGGTTDERFSYGIALGNRDGSPLNPAGTGLEGETYFADTAADAVAFHSAQPSGISQHAILETVKFAFIGSNGKYQRDPIINDVLDTPGAALGDPPAAQLALAISLGSSRRGATGRGRFYTPLPKFGVQAATMAYAASDAAGARDAAKGFLDAVNNQPGVDFADVVVVIVSSRNYTSPVTTVRVGRVPDTIRSRRRSLDEAYSPTVPVV